MRFLPILVLLLIPLLSGCGAPESEAAGYVNLSDLQPLPTPIESDVVPLRVAIAAVISPQGSAESYAPVLDYMSQELDRPVERIQRRTYAEVNELLRNGEVDIAFVCTSSYISGKEQFGLELLVAPQVGGETTYRAKIIVPAESSAESLRDLQGKVFAFTDPNSFTGRVYPTYLLTQMGTKPGIFFSRTFFTYSHDDAISAVADGIAEGASVDSIVLAFALKRNPELADQIRVIHTSPAFGMPPVVASPSIRPQLRADLADILLDMDSTEAGKEALAALDYDKFVESYPEDYLTAEEITNSVTVVASEP